MRRALLASLAALCALAAPAPAAMVTQELSFTADDGVVLHATIGGEGAISKRPLIIEDSPYAPGCCDAFAGPDYNYIQLQWRGTGQSDGALSTTGTRDQKDLSQFVAWACEQPWSDGNIGLYGFSASAIAVYNSLHLPLPCVRAAALMAGSVDLYRDLLWIGGVNNSIPGLVVEGGIFGPWLPSVPGRAQRPQTVADAMTGYFQAPLDVRLHETEDAYWRDRTFKRNANHIPILADTGFYDVESRGPFLAFRRNRRAGSHLLVIGAHDGFAGGTGGPFPQYARWFDHYVRGIPNGIDAEPPVSLYLSDGSRERLLEGNHVHLTGDRWPLRGTSWRTYYLSPAKSGSARSLNDGSLVGEPVAAGAVQSYPFLPSDPFATEPHTVSTVDGGRAGALTKMDLAEPVALTYTTEPFAQDVTAVGPVALDLYASSAAPVTDLVAVLADVWPDGSAHPVATGRLRTSYPRVNRRRSLVDPATGEIVQPYTRYARKEPPALGATRLYRIEVLPIGNRFAAGHRLRLYLVGTPAIMEPSPPGVNSVSIGGVTPSRLLLPSVG